MLSSLTRLRQISTSVLAINHRFLRDLAETFPRIQFVVTTHAPSVVSSARDSQLVVVESGKARTDRPPASSKVRNSAATNIDAS